MKIGILTFHHVHNYGAVLQAYALKTILDEMGHFAEFINYRNSFVEDRIEPFALRKIKRDPIKYLGRMINIGWSYNKQVRHFSSFTKGYLSVTNNRYSPYDIQQSVYEVLIIGSDQVWNPVITGGPDPVYWGNHKPKGSLLISYAVSSGDIVSLETDDYKYVNKWLERFDAISVREERLKKYVEEHSVKKAKVVLDPTLLAGCVVFERITPPRIIQEPYVLMYRVEDTANLVAIAQKVATLYHAKIIRVGPSPLRNKLKDWKNGIVGYNASVEELLSLVKYAECVIALSFHGTALSLLYEKDFYSVRGENMARVENILTKCQLMDRLVLTPDDVVKAPIDYLKVNSTMAEFRKDSLRWLEYALSNPLQ